MSVQRSLWDRTLGLAAALMVAFGLSAHVPPQAKAAASCDGTWQIQSAPSAGDISVLTSVSGTSTSDVWAVGYYHDPSLLVTLALAEHWDGTQWHVVSAHPPATGSGFGAVAAVSPTDVWAVGSFTKGTVGRTLIEHWDGRRWSRIRSPNVGSTDGNTLNAVAAVSATDVWAVGFHQSTTAVAHPLTLHWNGTAWSVVPAPDPGDSVFLYAVAASSSGDVWAVGYHDLPSLTFILHWDGSAWTQVSSPSPGQSLNLLYGVAADSPTDAWAVGRYAGRQGNVTMTLHWDGTSWSLVPSPNVGTTGNGLQAVWASSGEAWTVGSWDTSSSIARTLTEFWDGTAWAVVSSPNAGDESNGLFGVWGSSAANLWAVGTSATGLLNEVLVLRYC